MITICLIGDSHLVALKSGWDAVKHEFGDIKLTFFGAPGRLIDELMVSGGALVPKSDSLQHKFKQTSGGKSEIANDYDGYIVCGLGLMARRVLHLYEKYRAECHVRDRRQPISDECFHTAFRGILLRSRAVTITKYLREITSAPIGLVTVPMRSTSHPGGDIRIVEQNGDEASVAIAFASVTTRLSRELNVSLFLQPESTSSGPLRTNEIYSRASLHSANDDVDVSDYMHMNAAYGELILRNIFAEFPRPVPATVSL